MFKSYNDYLKKKVLVLEKISVSSTEFYKDLDIEDLDLYDILIDLKREDLVRGIESMEIRDRILFLGCPLIRLSPSGIKYLEDEKTKPFA